MERENNKLKFTLIWSSCICVLLLMVVFGISSSAKGTMAASCTSDTCTCPNGSYPTLDGDYCYGYFDEEQSSAVGCKENQNLPWLCWISATIKDTDDAKIYIYLVGNGGAVGGDSYKYLECPNGSCSLPTADKDDIKFLGWSVGSKSCTSLVTGTYKTSAASGTKLYACWDDPDYAWFWTPAEGPEACLPYKEYFGKSGYTYIKKASSCSTGNQNDPENNNPEKPTPPSSDPEPSSEPSVSDPSDEEISSRPSSDNVETNPPTGDIAIFVVWVLAAAAIVYSVWYFKQVREN